MLIDNTVTLGDVMILVGALLSVSGSFWLIKRDIAVMRTNHDNLQRQVDRQEARHDKEIEKITNSMSKGFQRIYDKLDGKEDKE